MIPCGHCFVFVCALFFVVRVSGELSDTEIWGTWGLWNGCSKCVPGGRNWMRVKICSIYRGCDFNNRKGSYLIDVRACSGRCTKGSEEYWKSWSTWSGWSKCDQKNTCRGRIRLCSIWGGCGNGKGVETNEDCQYCSIRQGTDWYMSSQLSQNGAFLIVDGDESTCMVTGHEQNPWAALTLESEENVHAVAISGRFRGRIRVRVGAALEKKGHVVPPVTSSTLCGVLPMQRDGTVEGTLQCWETGVGNTIYLIGKSDKANKMEICSLKINP